jgi:hypothetical protein
MALAKSQRSLKAWGKQKWRTKSGKKSSETGERYLPEGQTICEATERDCKENSEIQEV